MTIYRAVAPFLTFSIIQYRSEKVNHIRGRIQKGVFTMNNLTINPMLLNIKN